MPTTSSTPSGNTPDPTAGGNLGSADRQSAWLIRCAHASCNDSASVWPVRRSSGGARCSARGRQLPRSDAARLRLRRARTHRAAARRAAALLPRDRAPEPRRGSVAHAAVRPAARAVGRDDPGPRRRSRARRPTPACSRTRRSSSRARRSSSTSAAWKKLNKLLAEDARAGAGDRVRERRARRRGNRGVPDRDGDPALQARAARHEGLSEEGPRRAAGPLAASSCALTVRTVGGRCRCAPSGPPSGPS